MGGGDFKLCTILLNLGTRWKSTNIELVYGC